MPFLACLGVILIEIRRRPFRFFLACFWRFKGIFLFVSLPCFVDVLEVFCPSEKIAVLSHREFFSSIISGHVLSFFII